jgi:hypothetical protein
MNWFSNILLSLLLFLTFVPLASAIDSTQDQNCSVIQENYDAISEGMLEQSFVPTQNRLHVVALYWFVAANASVGSVVTISIIDGIEELESETFTINEQMLGQKIWPSVDFWDGNWNSYDIPLTVGHTYKIRLTIQGSGVFWYKEGGGNCNTQGTALINTVEQNYDYGFTTYGYDYVAPTTTTTTTTVSPVPTTKAAATVIATTTTTTTSPKTTISEDIKAPIEPKAEYDSELELVNLSWKASETADIEGYIILRSEDNKTFTELATVKKELLVYVDKDIVQGKTYYYQLKAYKGTVSSIVSDTVSAIVTKSVNNESLEIVNDEPQNKTFFTLKNILLMVGGIITLVAIGIGVMIYLKKKNILKNRI